LQEADGLHAQMVEALRSGTGRAQAPPGFRGSPGGTLSAVAANAPGSWWTGAGPVHHRSAMRAWLATQRPGW
jgi:hypothetical protein